MGNHQINIPEELNQKIRIYAAQQNISMKSAIVELLIRSPELGRIAVTKKLK